MLRTVTLASIATLALWVPRAAADLPRLPWDPMVQTTMTAGCIAGSMMGGYTVRLYLPVATTLGEAAIIATAGAAGCAIGAVAGALTVAVGQQRGDLSR